MEYINIKWFFYFSVRGQKHSVRMDSGMLSIIMSNLDVPQGLILGPLLFSTEITTVLNLLLMHRLNQYSVVYDAL